MIRFVFPTMHFLVQTCKLPLSNAAPVIDRMIHPPGIQSLPVQLTIQWNVECLSCGRKWMRECFAKRSLGICLIFSLCMDTSPAPESPVGCYDRCEAAEFHRKTLTETCGGDGNRPLIGEAASTPYHRTRPGHRPQLLRHVSCRLGAGYHLHVASPARDHVFAIHA